MNAHTALQSLGIKFEPARSYWNSLLPIERRNWMQSIGLLARSQYSFMYWDALPQSLVSVLRSNLKDIQPTLRLDGNV